MRENDVHFDVEADDWLQFLINIHDKLENCLKHTGRDCVKMSCTCEEKFVLLREL